MARWIALLRGINVGGRNRLPMAELRALAEELGWADARTFIQSGNLAFTAAGSAGKLEAALESAIGKRFKFLVPVMVRGAEAWTKILAANPFPAEAAAEADRVMVAIPKHPLVYGAAETLEAKAADGERVRQTGGVLWFHYPHGAGRSKLTPSQVDKAAGSPVTARNWRTALALAGMLEA